MSTCNIHSPRDNNRPKFTRGEKCLYTHVVVTFVLLLILVIAYLIHLFVVHHTFHDQFATRRFHLHKPIPAPNIPIGLAYINATLPVAVCNTILFRQRWSIAPGHCVAMRSEPDMAYVFLSWRIKYTSSDVDTEVNRSIVHPHFNRNTLANNIGLFQHTHDVKMQELILPTPPKNGNGLQNRQDMIIGSWDSKSTFENRANIIKHYPIQRMTTKLCSKYMSSIMNLRSYEMCVTLSEKQDVIIEHGAVVIADKISGIFSWGEKNAKTLPFVILNISLYYDWITYEVHHK